MTDFQKLLATITRAKDNIERAMITQREMYEKKIEKLGHNPSTDTIIKQMKAAEKETNDLADKLRMADEEKNLQALKIDHLTRECQLFERHMADLERQIETQQKQIKEATKEHTESIKMLAEMRLEQELQRHDQQNEFSKINEELQRIGPNGPSADETNANDTNALLSASAMYMPNTSVMSTTSRPNQFNLDNSRVNTNLGPEQDGHKALEMKHFKMVEELAQMERELKESKETYEKELSILKQQLHQEKQKVRTLQVKLQDSQVETQLDNDSLDHTEQRPDQTQFISELIGVREKLNVLQKASKTLRSENTLLKVNMKKQEDVVKKIQNELDTTHGSTSVATGQQITLLQDERDELLERLNTMTEQDEEMAEMLEEKYKLEQKASREREQWKRKCKEKEQLEIQLLQERMERERQIRDITQLQGLIRQRVALEQETEKMSVATGTGQLDGKAKVKESVLAKERARLGIAIGQKLFKPIATLSTYTGKNLFLPIHNSKGALTRPDPGVRLGCGCVSEEGSAHMLAKCTYHVAIERLRTEMREPSDTGETAAHRRGRSTTRKKRN